MAAARTARIVALVPWRTLMTTIQMGNFMPASDYSWSGAATAFPAGIERAGCAATVE